MEITTALQQLAKCSHESLPVVSVYFNTQWPDRYQRAEAARANLAQDLTRLEQRGRRLLDEATPAPTAGVALFTCRGADLWVEFPSPMPFENEFTIADRPALRQLARLDAESTNALVVLLDAHAARICEVVLGEFLAEVDFGAQAATPPRGWGQLRYRRQAKRDVERHYREVADYLSAYLTKRPSTSIVLSGPEEVLAAFRAPCYAICPSRAGVNWRPVASTPAGRAVPGSRAASCRPAPLRRHRPRRPARSPWRWA